MQTVQIKAEKEYRGLLKEGYSNQSEIRTDKNQKSADKNEKGKPFEEWTKEELYQEAIKANVPGRSYMNKKSLIRSLRSNQN
ncbi:hypothetical protein SAMN05444397_101710 [Flavobacterium aquidurense]|uniref:Rho termination factor n=1 Tax=Flavobacterium frigidimaris TaxID=262320 RepID=A0ABX4BUG4_FLAFR|nr:Rho termination factor [Flavobacterium frigidimaris]OXA80992.1 Rho termination factor [Flavobacterium frigidimaris]SDY46513.1 hypothetical protein SAMN05444397_101710 [Flavobacterium aquidurense]